MTMKFAFEYGGESHELGVGENLIGSGEQCRIRIEADKVEAVHAAVALADDRAILQTRSADEDVRVNGKPSRVEDLSAGDVVRIGKVELTVRDGDNGLILDGAMGSFELKTGENVVGREPELPIVLDDPSVSRRHTSILALPSGKVRIRDLGSSNGTFVNGRRLGEVELATADVVEVGDQRLTFLALEVPSAGQGSAASSAGGAAPAGAPSMPKFELIIDDEPQTLEKGELRIGRAPDCDIQISHGEQVSRYHARLTVETHRVQLEDQGSSNGTLVNGKKIDEAVSLAHGDRISIGGVELVFRAQLPVDPLGATVLASNLPELAKTVLAGSGGAPGQTAPAPLSPKQAALSVLELPPSASPQAIEKRYKELYSDYQIRLTNAPTPDLKGKFEEKVKELKKIGELLLEGEPPMSGEHLPSVEPVDESSAPKPPPASPQAPKVPKVPKAGVAETPSTKAEAKDRQTLPRSAMVMAALALLALGVCVFLYFQSRAADAVESELTADLAAMEERIASMQATIPETQAVIDELQAGKLKLLENFEFKFCNDSARDIRIIWLDATYVGEDGGFRTFNSAYFGYPRWSVAAGGTAKFNYVSDSQEVWNGSAVFYSVLFQDGRQEVFRSGAVQAIGSDCLHWRR